MTNHEKELLAQFIIDTAKKHGADEIALSISNDSGVEIQYRDGEIEQLHEAQQSGLAIQIYADHKYSSHSTNDLNKKSLERFIEQAVLSTKYLTSDPYRSLPDPDLYPKDLSKDLQLFDQSLLKLDTETRLKMVREVYEAAKKQSNQIISVAAGYSDGIMHSFRVHSNGFSAMRQSTILSLGAEVTVRDGDARPEDWYYIQSRFVDDLPDLGFVGEKASKGALSKIGQSKAPSGTYQMLVENRAAGRLIGMLTAPLTAAAIQQKSSYLEGMLNKQIASEKLTIIDDPFIPKGFASRLYDGRGIAARKRTVIEKGVLRTYFVDDYYGKKLGMEINGGSTSNLIFETGNHSLEEIAKSLNKGILITGFNGGNSNPTTGDFSFGISGFLIENGKMVHPVNEMNISGNAKDLWKKLVELGNDPYQWSSRKVPSLLFEDIVFSGV